MSYTSAGGGATMSRGRNNTVKAGKSTDALDDDDLLLAGARLHQKVRADARKSEKGKKGGSNVPIVEEEFEDDFDDGTSHGRSNSKETASIAHISEARNFESNHSHSRIDKSASRTEDSKLSDSLVGGVKGALNVFKQSLSQSPERENVRTSNLSNVTVSELGKSPNTPVLGTANNTTTIDQIPDEVDEKSDEYTEPDDESSSDNATLDKVSASKSGRLPPLSHQHPHGVSDHSLS